MTPLRRIHLKLSESAVFIDIMLVSKYEVVCIIQTKVMNNYVFAGLTLPDTGYWISLHDTERGFEAPLTNSAKNDGTYLSFGTHM